MSKESAGALSTLPHVRHQHGGIRHFAEYGTAPNTPSLRAAYALCVAQYLSNAAVSAEAMPSAEFPSIW